MLPALDNSIGCAISSVAGAGLHYWMRRFKCLLIANSAGANSNLPTPIACAAYSADHISTIQKCATVVQLFVADSCFCGWCGGGGVQY